MRASLTLGADTRPLIIKYAGLATKMLTKRILFLLLLSVLLLVACTKPRDSEGLLPGSAPYSAAKASTPEAGSESTVPFAAAAAMTPSSDAESPTDLSSPSQGPPASGRTNMLMHNVILTEKPGFALRVRWLRGTMHPTQPGIVPSFDEPNSFVVDVEAGVVATTLDEISGLLNGGMLAGSPLEKVSLSAQGQQLKLNGTLHKGFPLPIEMVSDVSASPDGRIQLHAVKLRVLKLPVKSLLQSFHVKVSDLVNPKGAKGLQIVGNDIYLNIEQVLPPPAIRGKLTDAHIGSKSGDLITVFGNARPEVAKSREWKNFISLRGGAVNFGKLTMVHADLVLIDASDDEWFDFDLAHYQEQLVNGRIQMTPQAGLRVYMPDINKIPHTAENRSISPEWRKSRNLPPPAH